MLPSTISVSDGFETDSVDVKGPLTSLAMREEYLHAGRSAGAALAIFITDWEAALVVARGELGEALQGRHLRPN